MDDALELGSDSPGPAASHIKKPSLKLEDPEKERLREACFKDSFNYSHKQRHGLFSQPYSTACGDTNYIKPTRVHRNEEGEVEFGPDDFKAGVLGHGPAGRVNFPGFICNATGDPYAKPPIPGQRTIVKDGFKKGGHELDFFPAKTFTH